MECKFTQNVHQPFYARPSWTLPTGGLLLARIGVTQVKKFRPISGIRSLFSTPAIQVIKTDSQLSVAMVL